MLTKVHNCTTYALFEIIVHNLGGGGGGPTTKEIELV